MRKKMEAHIGTIEDAAAEFVRAWNQASKGESTDSVIVDEKIYFENAELLMKALSHKRLDVLRAIRLEGETSILALSKKLSRNYKNVYNDVSLLERIGLIRRNASQGKISVPWKCIRTEINIDAGQMAARGAA